MGLFSGRLRPAPNPHRPLTTDHRKHRAQNTFETHHLADFDGAHTPFTPGIDFRDCRGTTPCAAYRGEVMLVTDLCQSLACRGDTKCAD
jgi:hypothetical protein